MDKKLIINAALEKSKFRADIGPEIAILFSGYEKFQTNRNQQIDYQYIKRPTPLPIPATFCGYYSGKVYTHDCLNQRVLK